MKNWLVNQMRFSGFTLDTVPELHEIWAMLTSIAPTADDARRLDGFRRMAASLDGEAELELIQMPGRIDIICSPPAPSGVVPNVVHMGDAEPRLAEFAKVIDTLLPQLTFDFQRIAFGLVLFRAVPTREAAYEGLKNLTPVNLDPTTSRDFLYQINHPEQFAIGDGQVELNRLSKWSAVRVGSFSVQVKIDGVASQIPLGAENKPGENFIRCEIDNSSSIEATGLAHDKLGAIFNRLVAMSNITAQGDDRAIV